MVELPSKPHSGSCSSVGNESNSLIWVLPRRFGTGVYPSSQIYSSLYLVIEPLKLTMRKVRKPKPMGAARIPRPPSAAIYKAFYVPIRRTAKAPSEARAAVGTGPSGQNIRCDKAAHPL